MAIINELWWSTKETNWNKALSNYWNLLREENIVVEKRFQILNTKEIETLTAEEFYEFLYNDYYVWKYTAKNRLTTTRMQLERYKTENRMNELERVHRDLFSFDVADTSDGLEIAKRLLGLGTAGASGLLANLYPKYFGTVDQFVVKSLCNVENLPEKTILEKMKPEKLTPKDGVCLIRIMKTKAVELNNQFNTSSWTPRNIDKILWSIDRN